MFEPKRELPQSSFLENFIGTYSTKIILEDSSHLKKDLIFLKRLLLKSCLKKQTAFLFSDSMFIPFLNCEENVFIGLSGNRSELEKSVADLLKECHISPKILKLLGKDLTLPQQIELQILRSIILQHKTVIIGNLLDSLPDQELYRTMNLLHYLARQYKFSLVIFTTKEAIANSPFCDQLIDASNVPLYSQVNQTAPNHLFN